MTAFSLEQSPFAVLGVPVDASEDDIDAAVEEASYLPSADEDELHKCRDALRPANRLFAEVRWLTDLETSEADRVVRMLRRGEAENLQLLLPDLPPLSKANLAADCCGRFGSLNYLRFIELGHREITAAGLAATLNEARRRAGLRNVELPRLDDALRAVRRDHAEATVSQITQHSDPPATFTETLRGFPDWEAEFVAELARAYDRWCAPHLNEIRQNIDRDLLTLVNQPSDALVAALCGRLREWDYIIQPAQVLSAESGLDEPRTLKLYRDVRQRCVELANSHRRFGEALKLTETMADLFGDLPTASAQLAADRALLSRLLEQSATEESLAPLLAAIAASRNELSRVISDLKAHSFSDARNGIRLKTLHQTLLASHRALTATPSADEPLLAVRDFALELNNEDNDPVAAYALLAGAAAAAPPISESAKTLIREDLLILRDGRNSRVLAGAIAARRWDEAARQVDAMLALPDLKAQSRVSLIATKTHIANQRSRQWGGLVFWGVIAVLVLVGIMIIASQQPQSTASQVYAPSAAQDGVPSPPLDVGSRNNAAVEPPNADPAPEDTMPAAVNTASLPSSPDETTNASETSAGSSEAQATDTPDDQTVPVYGVDEIQYCESERIRMATLERMLRAFPETPTDSYNERVSAYNARCGHFRYRSGDLDTARARAENNRANLEAEASATFGGWPQQ